MTRDWIFVPVIAQVLMTLLIYVRLIKVKIREMKAGKVDMARRGLHEDAWGEIRSPDQQQHPQPVRAAGAVLRDVRRSLGAGLGAWTRDGGGLGVRPEPHRARHDPPRLELHTEPPAVVHRRLVGADGHGPADRLGARPARGGVRPIGPI